MASHHHHHHHALWAKLHDLEVQLAAYKLLRAARGGEDAGALGCADGAAATAPGGGARRGRQYDAYMRRRDARRVAAAEMLLLQQQQQHETAKVQQARGARAVPASPRAFWSTARDTQNAGTATPRLAVVQAKRTLAASIPSTPRREAAALPRSKTVNGGGSGAAGSPARSSSHHQRRSSLGALAEFGECATPRPFLKRGKGTGGAAAPARLRTTRVHDLPGIDVAPSTPRPRPLPQPRPQPEPAHANAHAHAPRHARSVSELLPLDAALASPQARARKRWGSPERPAAMFSAGGAGDSHRDLSKGLRKLLSFVRKGGRGGDQQPFPAPSPRVSGKPVNKGWSGCSLVNVPFDRANLEAHRFPMTPRAVGISG